MIRLRVAGGVVFSQWVPIRFGRADLHGIVEDAHWDGKLTMGTSVIVDVGNLTPEELDELERMVGRLRSGLTAERERLERLARS